MGRAVGDKMSGRVAVMASVVAACATQLPAATLTRQAGNTGDSVASTAKYAAAEWRYYAGDVGGTKYSSLDQIDVSNAKTLQIAWRWKSDNFGSRPDTYLQSTPLMVGGVLYTVAGNRRAVVAIDAATGETLWMYRYTEVGDRDMTMFVRSATGRGPAYWTDGKDERIIHVTRGYRLVALDAKTGRPISSFGHDGEVDLYEGFSRRGVPGDGFVNVNSPALVVGDMVVVGAAFSRRAGYEAPIPGSVRGYDVRTGEPRWTFHTIPSETEFSSETWADGSLERASNVGMWASASADLELGYVYLPLESASNDLFGGHRHGSNMTEKNLFANTLVCLDAKTGRRVWHYQITHHDLWDYDLPAQPVLVDITVDGREIKAVAQITKQGFVFVFDRITGEPVWPIEERPVPESDVPGEKASPTQPFPTKPAPFERQGLTAEDVIDLTPELKAEALKVLSNYRIGPLYTPPSRVYPSGTKGTVILPGMAGGANWQGAGVDPETGVLYVPSTTSPSVVAVRECEPEQTAVPRMKYCPAYGRSATVQGLPIVKPPWGRITAIDLTSGNHLWVVANSDTPESVKKHPALSGIDLPPTGQQDRGAVLVTKTLLFAGEGFGGFAAPPGSGGRNFRAYDKRTGAVVAELTLPANQTSAPMTYMVQGKQYVVVGVGGANHWGEYVALTLP